MAAISFDEDDQSVKYARRAGVFIEGIDWEVPADRRPLGRAEVLRSDPMVIFCFGQSNAANHGIAPAYTPRHPVFCFNPFDCRFYAAADPLPGASGSDASPWGRLGDLLIEEGHAKGVVFISIAFGGTFVADWAPGGERARRLVFALQRARRAGLWIDLLLWCQGEAEANNTEMKRATYKGHFRSMLSEIRRNGVDAPILVARATLCATEGRPFDNRREIRSAQAELVDPKQAIFAGPDADEIGFEGRHDGCHFNEQGLQRAAELWFQSLALHAARPAGIARGSLMFRLGRRISALWR